MKNRLFIKLPETATDAVHWGIWSPDRQQWLEHGELLAVDLVSLAERSAKCETIAIAPIGQVAYRRVTTPAKQLKQIQRAVPYMLEDQIANPVDQLHFAYGKRNKQGEIEVFWITHEVMQQWQQWFEQAEVVVDAVVAMQSLLKGSTDTTEILLDDHMALVNPLEGIIWSCQRDLLPELWKVQQADKDEDESLDAIRVFHVGELEDYWQSQEQVIAQPLTAQELLESLALGYSRETVNLLQQQYAPKRESSIPWKKYQKLAYLMGATLVVYLGYQGSRYYALSEELAVLEQQGKPLFTKVFSRRPRPGSLLGQTERLMKRSGGEAKQGEFLDLLNKTTVHIQSVSVIKPTSITFDGRRAELRLDVLAPDYESLNQFKAQLTNSGLQVDMSSASAQGDKYSTRLSIRSGS